MRPEAVDLPFRPDPLARLKPPGRHDSRCPMPRPFAERRKNPRVGADFFLHLRGPESVRSMRVKDISASGVCCHSDVAIPEMTRVYMEISLPGQRSPAPISADGAVDRCTPRGSQPGYDVAIFFLEISQESRDAITRYVESRIASPASLPRE
jgi:hypothetical protein